MISSNCHKCCTQSSGFKVAGKYCIHRIIGKSNILAIALKIEIGFFLIWRQGSDAAITTNVIATPLAILRDCMYSCTAASKSTPSSKGLAFRLISSVLTVTVFVRCRLTVDFTSDTHYFFQPFQVISSEFNLLAVDLFM